MHDHLSDETLAGLIDETLDPSERDRAVHHIRSCDSCRQAYLEAGRLAGVWQTAPGDFPGDPELANLARQVLQEGGAPGLGRTDLRPRPRRLLPAALAAALGIVIVATILLWNGRRDAWDADGKLGPVYAAVLEASNRGPFVLPGAETSLDPSQSVTRSGFVASSDTLRAALRRLRDMYEQGDSPALAARWAAAAEIATGQIEAARALLDHARSLRSEEPDLATLDALVAYIDGNLEQAENLLRWVLERYPDNDVARVNLALILQDAGRRSDGETLLRQVITSRPGSALAARARSILESPPGP